MTDMEKLARAIYKSRVHYDAWDEEQESLKMRYRSQAETIFKHLADAGLTVVSDVGQKELEPEKEEEKVAEKKETKKSSYRRKSK